MIITTMKYFSVESLVSENSSHSYFGLSKLKWGNCSKQNGTQYIFACIPFEDVAPWLTMIHDMNTFTTVRGYGDISANDDIPGFSIKFTFTDVNVSTEKQGDDLIIIIELSKELGTGLIERVNE